jgi:hypothetical protein
MANVSVTIVGGTDAQNTTAVTVDNQRWGVNGSPWGTVLQVAEGYQTLTVFKTTVPNQISITLQVRDPGNNTLQVTVNQDNIAVVDA